MTSVRLPIPVPGTSVSSLRPWHNTGGTSTPLSKYPGAGTGTGTTFVHVLPGTSVSSVRLPYPYPELLEANRLCSVGYRQNHARGVIRTRNLCKFYTPVAQYPGYGYIALANIPGFEYGYG